MSLSPPLQALLIGTIKYSRPRQTAASERPQPVGVRASESEPATEPGYRRWKDFESFKNVCAQHDGHVHWRPLDGMILQLHSDGMILQLHLIHEVTIVKIRSTRCLLMYPVWNLRLVFVKKHEIHKSTRNNCSVQHISVRESTASIQLTLRVLYDDVKTVMSYQIPGGTLKISPVICCHHPFIYVNLTLSLRRIVSLFV